MKEEICDYCKENKSFQTIYKAREKYGEFNMCEDCLMKMSNAKKCSYCNKICTDNICEDCKEDKYNEYSKEHNYD